VNGKAGQAGAISLRIDSDSQRSFYAMASVDTPHFYCRRRTGNILANHSQQKTLGADKPFRKKNDQNKREP